MSPSSERAQWPEASASFYGWWMYSYMSTLLAASNTTTHATEDSLFFVSPDEDITTISETYTKSKSLSNNQITNLLSVGRKPFVRAGLCQVGVIVCQTSLPLILYLLINLLEANSISPDPEFLKKGLFYSALMGASTFFNAFLFQAQIHLAMRTGIRLRACLINELYNHTLRLTPSGRSQLHSGELTNLSANDAQKIFEVFQEAHLLWSAPLQAVLVSTLLILILGPVTIVGIAVLVSILPAVRCIVRKLLAVRSSRMPISDNRVKSSCEVLTGIKVTKLNFWENSFYDRIAKLRVREMIYVRKELAVWGVTLFLTVLTPVVATAATFITYATYRDGQVLTAADTFSVLCLFAALRFPINDMGKLLGNAAQAYKAVLRIDSYLSREVEVASTTTANTTENTNCATTKTLLEIKNGTFVVGEEVPTPSPTITTEPLLSPPPSSSTTFTLQNVNIKLEKSKFVAIYGGVGSGKSSLVQAICQLLPPTDPSSFVALDPTTSIAYSAQSPFIQNTSLKNNILFGQKFEPQKYSDVIEVCALASDLLLLPRGDETEIGERGVNLSGGQKARVSLARALYCEGDVLVLDDPLSALDADTGNRVFQNLKNSYLTSNSAVVLVTSASHFLSDFDEIQLLHDGQTRFQGSFKDLLEYEVNGGEGLSPDSSSNANSNSRQNLADVLSYLKTAIQQDSDGKEKENVDVDVAVATSIPTSATTNKDKDKDNDNDKDKDKDNDNDGSLMRDEKQEYGRSKIKVWTAWFKAAGGWPFVLFQLLFLTVDRTSYIATEWWLARWTEAATGSVTVMNHVLPAQEKDQWPWVKIYMIIGALSCAAVLIRTEWAVFGGARASEKLFTQTLKRTLLLPMSFFETVPLGRLLNRFTYDIEQVSERSEP